MMIYEEDYEYIVYIDEAGDDGLRKVRPIDPDGASEWLCLGAILIRKKYESELVGWVKEIREDINAKQGPALHYKNLSPTKRRRVLELLSKLPCRAFCVASNKKNMRGYDNSRASRRGGRNWFYNFCVRLLLERVTALCLSDALKYNTPSKHLKIVFSLRGGHSYGETKAYLELLRGQSASQSTYLSKREIKFEVIRYSLIEYLPHFNNAGLQLADAVSSSVYQAVEANGPNWDVQPAMALYKILAKERGQVKDFGIVLQPTPPWKGQLTKQQKIIFEHYGYKF